MSNEPTIEQMNKVIAEFMQLETDNESYLTPGRTRTVYLIDGKWIPLRKLKYYCSWDQLMPVVKKIYDTLADMLKKRPPHTACQGDLIEVDIHCAIREVDILKAHGHVYQFCLWYNKQKEALQ
jgi:hypothetical protein